ncbi:MAG TPA: SDR family NAD(P)-dependent oxidoreductase [Hyphomicrobiaceae bacterium]|nr:SDR family NAD(P)-dependent oxidoreductase [Hyphomicrobiaceae bacterium]
MSECNVAIVTGGSTGIGAEICRHMLAAGYEVVSLARRPPGWTHERLSHIEVDLLDGSATRSAAQDVAARLPVTHLVHNAGVIRPNLLPDVAEQDLHDLMQLHIGAALHLVQALLPGMQSRGFGRIIMMSSRAALGATTRTAYSATKAGIIGMTRTWALELAPLGITANVVAPGPIADTEMFEQVIPKGSAREEALANAIPMRRLGRADDVARAVMFFADRRNGYITGQALFVCGGSSVGTLTI